MTTVAILCSVFTAFVIPPEWRATQVRHYGDRAIIRITRDYALGPDGLTREYITAPPGCRLTDDRDHKDWR